VEQFLLRPPLRGRHQVSSRLGPSEESAVAGMVGKECSSKGSLLTRTDLATEATQARANDLRVAVPDMVVRPHPQHPVLRHPGRGGDTGTTLGPTPQMVGASEGIGMGEAFTHLTANGNELAKRLSLQRRRPKDRS